MSDLATDGQPARSIAFFSQSPRRAEAAMITWSAVALAIVLLLAIGAAL